MLDRVAVFAAAPGATFLTLLLELLLSFGIGEAEVELDATVLIDNAMKVLDYTLCNFTGLESTKKVSLRQGVMKLIWHTEQTQLPC